MTQISLAPDDLDALVARAEQARDLADGVLAELVALRPAATTSPVKPRGDMRHLFSLGLTKAGDVFWMEVNKVKHTAVVDDRGRLVVDQTVCGSPSRAYEVATTGTNGNGYLAWRRVGDNVNFHELRAELRRRQGRNQVEHKPTT